MARVQCVLAGHASIGPRPTPHDKSEPISFQIDLTQKSGTAWHITTFQAPLNQPIPVYVENVGDFLVSPVEFGNKIPDPNDFAPAGLWVSANGKANHLTVKGKTPFELAGAGEDWRVVGPKKSVFDLDDFPGVIIGRQAIGHPDERDPRALGLDPP